MDEQAGIGLAIVFGVIFFVIGMGLAVAMIAGLWKVFVKAGKPGWAAIIPIYNYVVMIEIIGKPMWWLVLLLVPYVNFVGIILVNLELAKRFGKSTGFAILMVFLPFVAFPMLGFGDAAYTPPPPESASA